MGRTLPVLCCLLWAESASGDGDTVTVVVHGADILNQGGPLWDMGEALYDYWKDKPGGAVEFRYLKSTVGLEVHEDRGDPDNAHKIIVFDWAEESDRPQGGYDEAAGDALFAMLVANNLVNSDYLHLIGHSRGTIVCSEAAQRILHHGYSVNQLTLLDTEPGPSSLRTDMAGPAHAWERIPFVDNYFGDGTWIPEGWDLKGEPIDGAYDRHLSPVSHSGVQVWYTETIKYPDCGDGFHWRVNEQLRPIATGLPTSLIDDPKPLLGVCPRKSLPEFTTTGVSIALS
jgi:hypothetical protein